MKKLKKAAALLGAAAVTSLLAGCGGEAEVWKPMASENTVGIAVVGDDAFYKDGGAVEAMELAAEDFFGEHGVRINVKYYDDDADYHKAIAFAEEIAADADIAA
ncbi:MAG: hypothetical protein NC192_11005, partial [Muribaculaceae bacterium]|nr:hypothetical protein [Muribaculaceae bacterium]